jgi:hypothetical protein
VLIIPGGQVLSLDSANKIKAFYDAGGTVMATKTLPTVSAEIDQDAALRQTIDDIFGMGRNSPMKAVFVPRGDDYNVHFLNRNAAGGRAYFIPSYNPKMIQSIMHEAVPVWDVNIAAPMEPILTGPDYNGSLTYIHKVKDGRNIYLFANSTDNAVDTKVTLRGNLKLSIWDPQTGKTGLVDQTHSKHPSGQDLTTVPLKLSPVTAEFLVEDKF